MSKAVTDKQNNSKGRTAAGEEHALIAERRAKLAGLREAGQAFPNGFKRNALAGSLHSVYGERDNDSLEQDAIEVQVAGRMMAKRVMGKASFAPIEDHSGRIQLFLQRDALPEGVYQAFKSWDVGDIVAATGNLFKTRKGELSVAVKQLQLLTKSLRPLPEKFHGLSDQETRYRQRYLDLIMNPDSRSVFRTRTAMVRFMRDFLDAMDFMEVETPMMQSIAGGALARPFATHHNALDMPLYLRIAPELFLKRLVVGGFERVYELNRCFRNEGLSTRHNPEFTMLEVYQAYAECGDMMHLTETLVRSMAASVLGITRLEYQGEAIDLGGDFQRSSVAEAVLAANPGLNPEALRDREALAAFCATLGVPIEDHYGAGKLQIEIFDKTVEAGLRQPTFITDYPAEVSPLARCNDDDPFITDRFELFIAGREIANGFSELNDPEDQAERFRQQLANRSGGDQEAMPYDEDYIRALEYGLPPTGGLGVGVDRLVMLFTDSASIRDVLLFPHMRPARSDK